MRVKICYIPRDFSAATLAVINTANGILESYALQGYDLTLRQLYYQFVARGFIPNKDSEYKKLGSIINDARLAGLVDWDHITDRTRNLRSNSHWNSPQEIVSACAQQFALDKWKEQEYYVEVWVEKDALIGVLEVACKPLDVPFFSCRGYTSQSEMWAAAMRLRSRRAQRTVIIHLGDHDPSGIDMSRDIEDRLNLFMTHHGSKPVIFERIALNMEQVLQYSPPPNPAKITDSRAGTYIATHGDESWELDALEPVVLNTLITETVSGYRDQDTWDSSLDQENEHKRRLQAVVNKWDSLPLDDNEEDGDTV